MSRPHEDHEPHELSPADQAAVERALAAVAPAPSRLDRDRLMFLAGAASASGTASLASGGRQSPEAIHVRQPGTPTPAWDVAPIPTSDLRLPTPNSRLPSHAWRWPVAAAALAATSLALAIALLVRPTPAERIVYLPQPARIEVAHAAPHLDEQPVQPAALATISRSPQREAPATNYVQTRDVALRLGLDALGSLPGGGQADVPTATYRSLLDALSPAPRAPSAAPESSQM